MQKHFDGDSATAHALDLRDFIVASPTAFHAAAEAASRLDAAGYVRQRPEDEWSAAPGGHYIVRSGAVVAWFVPQVAGPRSGFRIVGAHTDSPSFKVKPVADSSAFGFASVNVETYGGLLANSWLNRDLGVAGRVTAVDGEERLFATGPAMTIPQLAPHLDRSVDERLTLDRQRHLQPVCGTGERSIAATIAQSAGIPAERIAALDAYAFDVQRPQIISGEFLAGGRQDNLVSVHAGLTALLAAEEELAAQSRCIAVYAAFDHEEVGSSTATGAAGPLLEWVLRRTALALGAGEDEYYRMLARTTCMSADAGHSINPNYPGHHDPTQYPTAGGGPMVKVNANQRYASDSTGCALWLRAAADADQPVQTFVSNNSVPCGTTIGPLTATRLGIDTVDVGVPLLSMHSVRELSSIADDWALAQILRGYWTIA